MWASLHRDQYQNRVWTYAYSEKEKNNETNRWQIQITILENRTYEATENFRRVYLGWKIYGKLQKSVLYKKFGISSLKYATEDDYVLQ